MNERQDQGSAAQSSLDPVQFRFHKFQHLRSSRDFQQIYDSGQRAGDAHLLIFARRNQLNITRIGLSVSRKHGGAVQRNRRKRVLREAFRKLQHQLPIGLDLILIPRQGELPLERELQLSLRRLTDKLISRLPQLEPPDAAGV